MERDWRSGIADGADEVLRATRHQIKHGAKVIKLCATAGVLSAIALFKSRGVWLVPTEHLADAIALDALPAPIRLKAESVLPRMRASHRHAIAAGVKIALGSDAGVYPHGQNGQEVVVYTRLGMTPIEAIRAATVSAAELLGSRTAA